MTYIDPDIPAGYQEADLETREFEAQQNAPHSAEEGYTPYGGGWEPQSRADSEDWDSYWKGEGR